MKPHNRTTAQPHEFKARFSFLISLLILLTPLFASAQSNNKAFQYISKPSAMNASQQKMVSLSEELATTSSLKYLQWDFTKLDINGVIRLPLHGNTIAEEIVEFEVLDIKHYDENSYMVVAKNEGGSVVLFKNTLGIGGTIDYQNISLDIYPLGSNKSILYQKANQNNTAICATGNSPLGEQSLSGFCDMDCGGAMVDVTAIVTPNAWSFLQNKFGTFADWVLFYELNNINAAFILSDVKGWVRTHWKIQSLNFISSHNISIELVNAKTSNQIAAIRSQFDADIVMVLTNHSFNDGMGNQVFGAIPDEQINPESPSKIGFVEVPFIGPIRYTYAHELAHHFGGRHDDDNSSLSCPHGKKMLNGRNTILAKTESFTRIPHFSNPNIDFNGESTGDLGFRDNAAQIRGAICTTASLLAVEPFSVIIPSFVVDTIGPLSIGADLIGNPLVWNEWGFERNCLDNLTYSWTWSQFPDFSAAHTISGNGNTVFLDNPPHCPVLFIKVIVSSTFGCNANDVEALFCQGLQRSSIEKKSFDPKESPSLYPSPCQNYVLIKNFDAQASSVAVFSSNGGLLSDNIPQQQSEGQLYLNTSGLQDGLYFVRITTMTGQHLLKFIKTH